MPQPNLTAEQRQFVIVQIAERQMATWIAGAFTERWQVKLQPLDVLAFDPDEGVLLGPIEWLMFRNARAAYDAAPKNPHFANLGNQLDALSKQAMSQQKLNNLPAFRESLREIRDVLKLQDALGKKDTNAGTIEPVVWVVHAPEKAES